MTVPPVSVAPQRGQTPADTPFRFAGAWRRRPPVLIIAAMLVMVLVLIAAIFGPALAPTDPSYQDLAAKSLPPGPGYPLGTDGLGRDIFSRLIYGARGAVIGPGVITLGVFVFGSALGIAAGYFRGRTDALIMRWADLMLAFPNVLIVLVVAGVVGGGYWLSVALMIVLLTPTAARLVRGATLQQATLPYIEAAQALGISRTRVMVRHLWPNVAPLAGAFALLSFAVGLVALASLSFLGVGVGPGAADWGRMLVENRLLLTVNPWAAVGPGLAIVITAAAMNTLGDWLMERLDSNDGD